MPENQESNTAVAEVEQHPALEPVHLTTSLEDVFDKAFGGPEEREEEEQETATEPEIPTPEPVKVEPKKVEPAKEEAVADIPGLPSDIFGGKKEEAPAQEETELKPVAAPEGMKGKTKEHFEALSKKEFEARKQTKELERRLKEVESKATEGDPDLKARLQQAEAERDQYRERIYRADVTLDPRFEAQFTIPKNQHLERAKSAYLEAGGDPKEIEAALAVDGRARADKLDEIYNGVTNKYLLGKIENAVAAIENIDGQIAQVHQNREAWLKQSKEQEQITRSKQAEAYMAEVKTGLDEGEKYLQELGWEVFIPTNDPKAKFWNEQKSKIRENAEYLLTKVTDRKQMMIASEMAASAPVYRSMFIAQKQRADKAESLLKEYKNSDAGLGGDTPPSTTSDDDENLDFGQAVIRNLRRGK